MQPRSYQEIYQTVFDVLDRTATRDRPPQDAQDTLASCLADWTTQGGSEDCKTIIAKARGLVGMLNASGDTDPLRQHVLNDVVQLKKDWRSAFDALSESI